jgi:hypothetical protein
MDERLTLLLASLALPAWLAACATSPSTFVGEDNGAPASLDARAPYLTALAVADGVSRATVTLVPEFSSNVFDYYVRCRATANALAVTMTGSPGAETLTLEPTPSPARAATQTVSLNVREDQAIVAIATNGAATTQYWVRCLPHDFPRLQMDAHPSAGRPPPGYYLVGNRLLPEGTAGYAMVLNGYGVPVWYHREPQGVRVFDVDSFSPGSISIVSAENQTAIPFETHRQAPLSTTYVAPDADIDVHELQVLPNGDYLAFSKPVRAGVDLTGLTVPLPEDSGEQAFGPGSTIQDTDIVEFDPTGKVVWTWVGSDHIDAVNESTVPELVYRPEVAGGYAVDTFHGNSIDVDGDNGNLLVSARNTDSVFYIDRSTGTILWKMGGTAYSKDHALYVPVADPFRRQHDARLHGWSATCLGGSGQISLFDDESFSPSPARAVVYDVVVGGAGGRAGGCSAPSPRSRGGVAVWQYRGSGNSAACGSFRISPDGSRVVGWGAGAQPEIVFTEVDLAGEDLLDLYFTDASSSYRAIKVPLSALDLQTMRETAGLN